MKYIGEINSAEAAAVVNDPRRFKYTGFIPETEEFPELPELPELAEFAGSTEQKQYTPLVRRQVGGSDETELVPVRDTGLKQRHLSPYTETPEELDIKSPDQYLAEAMTSAEEKVKKAKSIAYTFDIPLESALKYQEELEQLVADKIPDWQKRVGRSFHSGMVDTVKTYASAFLYAGLVTPKTARRMEQAADEVAHKYVAPINEKEFTFDMVRTADFWLDRLPANIPLSLSLVIPSILVHQLAGAALATTAIGWFGKTVISALVGTVPFSIVESALEAGEVLKAAMDRGDDENEGRLRANYAFRNNLLGLTGLNAGQMALAFTPLDKLKYFKTFKHQRALAAGKYASVAATGAGEEAFQTGTKQLALGYPIAWDAEMKESVFIGGVFGFGFAGAGSIYNVITNSAVSSLDGKMLKTFDEEKQVNMANGMSEKDATTAALDTVAEIPEGRQAIEKRMKKLKDQVDPPIVKDETKDQAKEAEEEEAEVTELDTQIDDTQLDKIISGEKTIFDIIDEIDSSVRVSDITETRGSDTTEATEAVEATEVTEVTEAVEVAEAQVEEIEEVTQDDLIVAEDAVYEEEQAHVLDKHAAPATANLLVSTEMYENARASLRQKLSGLHANIDPTVLREMVIIGAYHIERGLRTFNQWSKAMIEKFGNDKVKPFLSKIWIMSNAYLEDVAFNRTEEIMGKETPETMTLTEFVRGDVSLSERIRQIQRDAKHAKSPEEKKVIRQEINNVVLIARIKAEAHGFKEGFRVGGRLTARHIKLAFQEALISQQESREVLIDYIKDHLPVELRGKYLTRIIKNMTKSTQKSLYDQIERDRQKYERQGLITRLEKLRKVSESVSLEYRKKIEAIVNDIDTKNITEKTIKKLEGLRDFLEKNGIPLNMKQTTVDSIKRLEKQSIKDWDNKDLQALVEYLETLRNRGTLFKKLQGIHDQRLIDKEVADLVSYSQNFDPDGTYADDSPTSMFEKRAAIYMYLNCLHPAKVADMIDGAGGSYAKGNARMIRTTMATEGKAHDATREIMMLAAQEMAALKINLLFTEAENVAMMIHIRLREGAREQVKTLLRDYKLDAIPEITAEQSKLIDIIEKYTNLRHDLAVSVYEMTTGLEFKSIPVHILPIRYKEEFGRSPIESVLFQKHQKKNISDKFAVERQEGVTKSLEINVMEQFEQAVAEQQWYIHLTPVLSNIQAVVQHPDYMKTVGTIVTKFWAERLDIIARRGGSALAHYTPFSAALKRYRGNVVLAILGFKLTSFLMQGFAVFDAASIVLSRYGFVAAGEMIYNVSRTWLSPAAVAKIKKESVMIRGRMTGETVGVELFETLRHNKGALAAWNRASMWLLAKADLHTTAGTVEGFKKILEKHGSENAMEEAEFFANMVAGSAEVTSRPNVLSQGEGARTWLTLQTFALARFGNIAYDLITVGAIKGDPIKKMRAAFALMVIIASVLAENEARRFVYSFFSGKKQKKKTSYLADIIFALPEQIPFFGSLLSAARVGFGGGGDMPLTAIAEKAGVGVAKMYKGVEEGDVKEAAKGALRLGEAALSTRQIGGVNQITAIIDGILFRPNNEKGY